MSIDYKQLQAFVKEAMFTQGGINEPSAPEGVPHRMPAADTKNKEQDMGDPKANKLYELALVAREAAEVLVEALDEPIYDDAYEHAFKASANLRRVLNSIEGTGAHPMPDQRVVAPPANQQRWSGYAPYQGGAGFADIGAVSGMMEQAEEEADDAMKGFGATSATKSTQARAAALRSKQISSGDQLGGVNDKERAMLTQIEKVMSKVASDDDLLKYRPQLETILKRLLDKSQQAKAKGAPKK